MNNTPIRIGTRGSLLAVAQAQIVQDQINHYFPGVDIEICIIQTQGDKDLTSPLSVIGGKGAFIRELEQALIDDRIDLAVHSLKDITTTLAPGLQLTAFLKAEAFADVLVTRERKLFFDQLPAQATIGTSSLRRMALVKQLRPDINTMPIRGNVITRLRKLDELGWDALILSEAGLLRLGLEDRISMRFDPAQFCPAPGQGVIALECRQGDERIESISKKLNHPEQEICTSMELALLNVVGAGCQIPLGLHATRHQEQIKMRLFLANRAMDKRWDAVIESSVEDRLEVAHVWGERCKEWLEQYDQT